MRFDHILFPIDFSETSNVLAADVEWLAQTFGSRVTLLHVFTPPVPYYGREAGIITPDAYCFYADEGRKHLDEYRLAIPESRIQRVCVGGVPAYNVASFANEQDVDVIVMGSHGYGALKRLLLGSVAMKVLHDVHCPVWTRTAAQTIRSPHENGVNNMVCSVDISNETVPMLRFSKEMAAQLGASVSLVHVVPEIETRPERYLDYDFHQKLREQARQALDTRQIQAETDFPLTITDHSIASDITEIVTQAQADLLIIGRGHTQELLGAWRSHTSEIIRQTPCPVLSFSRKAAAPLEVQADQGLAQAIIA